MSNLSRVFPRFDWIFQGKHFAQFLANKMQDFRNFVEIRSAFLHSNFCTEHVYLELKVTNVKNKRVAAN